MAALLFRSSCVQGLRKGLALLTSKEVPTCRRITTTSRCCCSKELEPKRKWISYGFSRTNETLDRHSLHMVMFFAVTVVMVWGGVVMAYLPDVKGKDWAQREAYLQLRYREEHGLLPIDPNVIDPSKVVLPTDEELGDTDIII